MQYTIEQASAADGMIRAARQVQMIKWCRSEAAGRVDVRASHSCAAGQEAAHA
ncbi:hypothetical protein [Burkholderia lata]|uniref:Uncharacterized protein n=1 Tax=Burkholderia lata (strain ATCC 17760 / DSM 23089 / LMG 22485 / NCIMB 9086 / R18194 / 383) TaxID=482957 RepID=A0A6P2IF41_BURL3|nr:hypothetical protein [Burkholderia lata]VWB29480.1 hypothetical protein BLA6863_01250 [Burkholderia lata]VWL87765.1 hypothetical protein BLA6992_00275 [Burkholderia lata]